MFCIMNIMNKFWSGLLWTLLIIKIIANNAASEESEDLVSTTVVEAVVGKEVTLACNINTTARDDRVYMVLWFRHAGGKPLYSFDVRGRPFNKALHWSDPQAFGYRARFDHKAAVLRLFDVELDDEGIYRCRVDFKNSPTRNFQIKLNVTVPPHQMLLYDEMDRDIAGVIGPLQVGANFTLYCEVRGGKPQPTLTWLYNNVPIEHTIVKYDKTVIVSLIQLVGAQRDWVNDTVRCQANNTNLISPYERSARVEMTLRPTSAALLTKPAKMFADREVTLVCVTHGSRPPAEISWFRDNRLYNDGRQHKVYHRSEFINDSSTVSRLTFKPQPEDHNVTMKCRADNVLLGVSLEDMFLMHVVYKPVVNLTLGSTLQANDIKEGDDVYFECIIKANPKEYRINWYLDTGTTRLIDKTPRRQESYIKSTGAGIFTSTKSLVLQKVNRSHGGLYSCVVANEIGETKSPDVYLRIQYAPVCSQPSPMLIGARIDEYLRIRCLVKADPANVNFTWLFNNSGESFEVSPHRYGPSVMVSQGGTTSELRYCASSERDYGTLTCLSRNAVGEQHKPCVFQLVPATRPSPPRNCSVQKVPRRAEPLLAVRCLAGYDGGLRQHFALETTGEPNQLLVNTSTPSGYQDIVVWLNVTWSTLEDIPDDQELMVIARNAKGPSEPFVFHGLVFKDPVKKIAEDVGEQDVSVPIAVSLIALAVLLAAAGAAAAYVCKKRAEISSAIPMPNKRPSQSVVQVDSQGRKYMFTYPETSSKQGKPDILLPKIDNGPPRVVLESSGDSYLIREVRPAAGLPPHQHDDVPMAR